MIESSTAPAEKRERVKTLLDAVGYNESQTTIVWGGTGSVHGLTDREIDLVKKKLNTKSIDYVRTGQIKSLMASRSCAQIVQHFRHKKGYGSSTIKHTHAALSQAQREKARESGAK